MHFSLLRTLYPHVRCVLSCSVGSDSLQSHWLQPAMLLCPLGFSRQESWSRLPCPSPGDLPSPGIKPRSPALQVNSLPSEKPEKPFYPHQFSSVVQSCLTLCDCMDCSTPGLPVHHQLPEFTRTHVHCVSDAIQPSHPLSSPSPHAFNLSQHQGLFKWVSASHHVAKVLEFQFQHQSFQWIFRTDLL